MKTYSIEFNSNKLLSQLVCQHPEVKEKEILVQVFTSIHQPFQIQELITTILSYLPQAKIIGTTTHASIQQNKIVNNCLLSITVFDKTNVIIHKQIINDKQSSYDFGRQISSLFIHQDEKVAFLFLDKGHIDLVDFNHGVQLNSNIKIFGGSATKQEHGISYVFDQDGIIQNGVVIATLKNKDLYIFSDINFGWTPVGKGHKVTNIKDDIVYAIDNIPAKTWYEQYIGYKNIKDDLYLAMQFPLMIKKDNIFITNPILKFTRELGIKTKYALNIKDEIYIGVAHLSEILNNLLTMSKKMSKIPIESTFVFSSETRKYLSEYIKNTELLTLAKRLNVTGVYLQDEIGYVNEDSVCGISSLISLSLSEYAYHYIDIDIDYLEKVIEKVKGTDRIIMNNLIKLTSNELEVFNRSLEIKVVEQNVKLQEAYYKDEHTNLYNKNKFNIDYLNKLFDKVALFDIDDFTTINSFYGSVVGNYILKQCGTFIYEYVKVHGMKVYHIASDKFAVVANQQFPDYKFLYIIRELQNIINKKSFSIDVHEIYLNILVSITIKEKHLLEKASLTLDYLRNHKKVIQVYHPILKIEEDIEKNIKWVKKIKKAISEDRIVPFFQAIYNNKTAKFDKYEALLRMIEEDGSIILPGSFLNIAKKSNIYQQLQMIMIDKTFKMFKDMPDYEFAINLTVDDLLNRETRTYIFKKLSHFSNPQNVIFEIVESEGIENFQEVKIFIDQVKKYGSKIAIDDFGTGYSNLSYLVQLQVDMIKVDGSIIKNLTKDKTSNLVAETILHLAKRLNVKTVAEFVEDENIFTKVKGLDIDYSQGFYFAKPKPKL